MSHRNLFRIVAINIYLIGLLTINILPTQAEELSPNRDQQIKDLLEKIILIKKQITELIAKEQEQNKKQNTVNKDVITPTFVHLNAPFTSQAPLGDWKDSRQQNGCEEAAALMAMRWAKGQTLSLKEAEKEIIAIADYETKNYGDHHDTSALDTSIRIFKGYFKYDNVIVKHDIGINDIKRELTKGNVIVIPINGRTVGNPYYTPPGPIEHMIAVVGFDDANQEFITHDPGTRHGGNYRYKYTVLGKSLLDYNTGYHEPVKNKQSAMIIVSK